MVFPDSMPSTSGPRASPTSRGSGRLVDEGRSRYAWSKEDTWFWDYVAGNGLVTSARRAVPEPRLRPAFVLTDAGEVLLHNLLAVRQGHSVSRAST